MTQILATLHASEVEYDEEQQRQFVSQLVLVEDVQTVQMKVSQPLYQRSR